jgi:hypothetical protein
MSRIGVKLQDWHGMTIHWKEMDDERHGITRGSKVEEKEGRRRAGRIVG